MLWLTSVVNNGKFKAGRVHVRNSEVKGLKLFILFTSRKKVLDIACQSSPE